MMVPNNAIILARKGQLNICISACMHYSNYLSEAFTYIFFEAFLGRYKLSFPCIFAHLRQAIDDSPWLTA